MIVRARYSLDSFSDFKYDDQYQDAVNEGEIRI